MCPSPAWQARTASLAVDEVGSPLPLSGFVWMLLSSIRMGANIGTLELKSLFLQQTEILLCARHFGDLSREDSLYPLNGSF